MIVVSDTTPIHYLILIDEIEIVSKLLGEVIIPDTVFRELNHAETPEKIKKYLEPRSCFLKNYRQMASLLMSPPGERWPWLAGYALSGLWEFWRSRLNAVCSTFTRLLIRSRPTASIFPADLKMN